MSGTDAALTAGRARPALWLAVFCGAIALGLAWLPFRSNDLIAGKPLSEDGFYVLSVARNIATGHGVTIDGVEPTNGFQPLFALATTPAFIVSPQSRFVALRIVLGLHWLVYLATALLLGLIARDMFDDEEFRSARFWLTAFLYLASLHAFAVHFNGLETGLAMMLYALAWRVYQIRGAETLANAAIIGALLGLTVLARIDASLLVAVFCIHLAIRRRIARAAIVATTAVVVSAPWWAYNLAAFGSLMPSSGTAQMGSDVSIHRVGRALDAAAQAAQPMLYAGHSERLWMSLARGTIAGVRGASVGMV